MTTFPEKHDRGMECLERIHRCFQSFGADPIGNINRLTALAGELAGATCALYNRLDEGLLCSLGQWNTPDDYDPVDKPEGHICFDVILRGDGVFVVNNLQESDYARTDPNVSRYGLKTYAGCAVRLGDSCLGSLCVVYREDVTPDAQDRKVLELIAAAIGMEERRRGIEAALSENEKRYKRLVESLSDYIYTVRVENGRAVATYHGPGCVNVTGYTSADYELDPFLWYRMVYEEDRSAVLEQAERMLSGENSPPLEHRIMHKNGTVQWVKNTTVPRYDDRGRLVAYDGVIANINERKCAEQDLVESERKYRELFEEAREAIACQKKLEQQLLHAQKMEAIGQLAGGVAHDFNNILTAIIGYANILLMKIGDNEALRTYVAHILESSDKATNLTKGLLTFGRKQIIHMGPADLNEIVWRIERLLSRLIGEDVVLDVSLAKDDLTIMADSGQIEQVLMNLCTNARDAMPGGGTLSIRTYAADLDEEFIRRHGYGETGSFAVLSVTDNGCGIDEKTKERIFEPFFTTKEVGKGTGLGLPIVYGIVKQHSGFINVYSEPGRGTAFRIYLPLVRCELEPVLCAADEPPVRGGSETILVAEDNERVRNMTRTVLEEFGYTVLEAADGNGAIDTFMRHRDEVALLLLDVVMPEKNGKEAYDEIKAMRPDIKAIFTSGYTADIITGKGISEGPVDFISKPAAPKELLTKVRAVLDERKG